jgi:hypothetical protein
VEGFGTPWSEFRCSLQPSNMGLFADEGVGRLGAAMC